jgi:16S rRNA (cytidine1402-2'-O)-methyltransferase
VSIEPGILYVVATPIGNLADLSRRAIDVLRVATLIAAEDTRHSGVLLAHYGIGTPLISLHDHNEEARCALILERLAAGETIALISDAGTPLISDPGFKLVRAVTQAGMRVSPIPGPCALIAALSAAGMPSDRFVFEGFLPAKSTARREYMKALATESRTLVFYESSHRILESLADAAEVFGPEREAALARELTKMHETLRRQPLGTLLEWARADAQQRRGEFVLLVAGVPEKPRDIDVDRVLEILRAELPPKQAVRLASAITGERRNALYKKIIGALPDPAEE